MRSAGSAALVSSTGVSSTGAVRFSELGQPLLLGDLLKAPGPDISGVVDQYFDAAEPLGGLRDDVGGGAGQRDVRGDDVHLAAGRPHLLGDILQWAGSTADQGEQDRASVQVHCASSQSQYRAVSGPLWDDDEGAGQRVAALSQQAAQPCSRA